MSGAKEQPQNDLPVRAKPAKPSISEEAALELLDWTEGLRPEFRAYFLSELSESEQSRIRAKAEEYRDMKEFQMRERPSLLSWIAKELPAAAVYAESIATRSGR